MRSSFSRLSFFALYGLNVLHEIYLIQMIKILLISSVPGLLVAGFMMYVAWNHNAQGEIHSEGVIDWSYWLLIGCSWFLPIFICSVLVGWLISWLSGQND
jgi:hypothetical protein